MSTSDIAISVRGVSKTYSIARNEEKHTRLAEKFLATLRNPLHQPQMESFDALKDISFDVNKGEVVGIIGRNGAGKSTLLKILSRITEPTTGEIKLYGRVASLLEVGTGFHQELSGRENIYLNGAILGMTKAEIRKQFDAIVDFSEIEKFLDTPVKRYSSGMYVRLAFAVAAHLNPEILIVDEVLAVGDAQFQKRCLGKIKEVSEGEGRTVLFVSHNMTAIASLTSKSLLLRRGRIEEFGPTENVVNTYFALSRQPVSDDLSSVPRSGSGKALFTSIRLLTGDTEDLTTALIQTGSNLEIVLSVNAIEAIEASNVAVIVNAENEVRLIDVNTAIQGRFLALKAGSKATIRFRIINMLLKPGNYTIGLWLGRGGIEEIDNINAAAVFEVVSNPSKTIHTENFPGLYQCDFESEIRL